MTSSICVFSNIKVDRVLSNCSESQPGVLFFWISEKKYNYINNII